MQSLTPVIFVEEIEPNLPFWYNLGFEKTIEVPEAGKLGFVALQNGSVEVMYQSRASIQGDLPDFAIGTFERSGACYYVHVSALDELLPKLSEVEIVVPERHTFYGAREVGVRAPCKSVFIFAEMQPQEAN